MSDVGFGHRRRVVDPVTAHRHGLAARTKLSNDPQLVHRRRSGHDRVVELGVGRCQPHLARNSPRRRVGHGGAGGIGRPATPTVPTPRATPPVLGDSDG